jgi:hypothetical protein
MRAASASNLMIIRKVNILTRMTNGSTSPHLIVYDIVRNNSQLYTLLHADSPRCYSALSDNDVFKDCGEQYLGERLVNKSNSEISIFDLNLCRSPNKSHSLNYLKIRKFLSLGPLSLRKK